MTAFNKSCSFSGLSSSHVKAFLDTCTEVEGDKIPFVRVEVKDRRPRLVGMVYARSIEAVQAQEQFIRDHIHVIAHINSRTQKVEMTDGTIYQFIYAGNRDEACRYSGINFYSLHFGQDVSLEASSFLRTRLRWSDPV
ncbi:hypothetical protein D3C78_779660 [compost metagenome]